MNTAKNIYFRMTFGFFTMAALNAHAATVNYTFDNVILADGEQITATFDWTFTAGDFEGGSGVFTALEIPYTIYSFADGNLNTDIQTNSIEISGNGNYHDVGLDITLVLSQPLSPTQSVSIDLDPTQSFFECCGNGFKDQPFSSGSISPTSSVVIGDANKDGQVTGADLISVQQNFGNVGAVPLQGDANNDGQVTGADLISVQQNFGNVLTPTTTTIPEPAMFGLIGVLVCAGSLKRPDGSSTLAARGRFFSCNPSGVGP